jgi:hypothetical protein
MTAPTTGSKIKQEKLERLLQALQPWLMAGEEVAAVVRTNGVRPFLDFVVITNGRVLGTFVSEMSAKGPIQSVAADVISTAEIRGRLAKALVVHTKDGEAMKFGEVKKEDEPLVLEGIERLRDAGLPDYLKNSSPPPSSKTAARARLADAAVVGQEVTDKVAKAISDHLNGDERPWLIVNADAFGTLVAFEDRLIVIKVGTLTSALAGSFGGGRVTVFPFSEITGIEYNAGLMNGVLEILTPSYSGGAEKDFWAKGANDPLKQSNTIPMIKPLYQLALPQLNELRKRIADYKRPQNSGPAATVAPSLSEELGRLAELHQQGVLDDDEFKEAKAALIKPY